MRSGDLTGDVYGPLRRDDAWPDPARPGGPPPRTSPVSDPLGPPGPAAWPGESVVVPAAPVRLTARLTLPERPRGVVAVTMGNGARTVATALHDGGLGTLLLDLLTAEETGDRHLLFDVPLLARRLGAACHWLGARTGLPVGCAGDGPASAAAIEAAAMDPGIRAIVSLDGRPELASPSALARVRAPVLLVVGEGETRLLGRNRLAAGWMRGRHETAELPGVARSVIAAGTAELVTTLSRDWFGRHLDGRS
ncbi:alpha/beta hydrolase [Streptomyces sp. NPDC057837]|uniref:alpha/beta hydrolase n=1 Tax=Streptomyces sp. NPDC057837 TaxID=3346260 RepID=UPI00367FAA1B